MKKLYFSLWILGMSTLASAGVIHRSDKELVPTIPITGAPPYDYQVLYSIGPLTILKGQIVDFRLQAEFTNDCGDNVGLGRYIIRTNSKNEVTGTKVNKAVMSNITPNEHHEVIVHSGLDQLSSKANDVYYNVIVYAASSRPGCKGSDLIVEGYTNAWYGEFLIEIR